MTAPKSRAQPPVWWLNPGFIMLTALVPFALAAYCIPEEEYVITWNTVRFFDQGDLIICISCASAFLLGGILMWCFMKKKPSGEWGKFTTRELDFLNRVFYFGIVFVLFAYCVWTLLGLHNGVTPRMVLDIFLGDGGASDEVKGMIGTIPGITTGTQFAASVFIIGLVLFFNGRRGKVTYFLIGLLIITFARSIIYSERVALTEVAIPGLVLTVYYCRRRLRFLLDGMTGFLWPIGAVLLLYLLFTGTEYFRSWKSSYEDRGDYSSVWVFSRDRLAGYYVTALNNGSLSYRALGKNDYPSATLDWLVRFPIIGSRVTGPLNYSYHPFDYLDILAIDANPEFNNPSGVFPFVQDYGEPGVYIFFFVVGFIVFAIYFLFVQGRPVGIFLYPFIVVGLTEIARSPFLTAGRAFPSWLLLFTVLYGLRTIHRKQRLRHREEALLFPSRQTLLGSVNLTAGSNGTSADPAAPTRN
jgi:hypothetical protein